ncbi:response regulator transcription factor [Pacificoceanicola onchidii]|uniref:response regulator transcription factor n=1 Tax=Pacificoceanicola onchidii TaxID=2562685 RepID=UPI0010A62840|nr:response regulator transcription factor [Pacificoceanicola onchidii]
MIPKLRLPPVGAETIVILGTKAQPGSVLNQSLGGRGFLPILAVEPQEVENLFDQAMVSALIVMDSVPVDVTLTLCRSLRARNAVTPIMVLLNEQTNNHGIELLEAGADHFEVQPVAVEDLLRALYAFTRRSFRLPKGVMV